jgi:predicted Rossmann fold nucleotide-binding protein DprA/Smf involved in DNA uptake
MSACDDCLRRSDLIAAVAGRLDVEWRRRSAPAGVLSLPDEALVALDASGVVARRYASFSADAARAAIAAARLTAICRCDPGYPERLRELADPPALLHLAGDPCALEPDEGVAIVGARRGTAYGLEVARSLGRGVAAAGVPVISGMAMGVDSAAHVGALEHARPAATTGDAGSAADVGALEHAGRAATAGDAGSAAHLGALEHAGPAATAGDAGSAAHLDALEQAGPAATAGDAGAALAATRSAGAPIAVLAGGADVPYPPSRRGLYAKIVEHGCVLSELPPGFEAHRWSFVARNRIIAGLAALTVVVEAAERSGSLTTADFATQLGRPVGAVPGLVTSRFSAGTNGLLAAGAGVVRDARDVLDQLLGPSAQHRRPIPPAVPIEPRLRRLLDAIERGHGSLAELAGDPSETNQILQDLTDLELRGLVRREFGGRYVRALEGRP